MDDGRLTDAKGEQRIFQCRLCLDSQSHSSCSDLLQGHCVVCRPQSCRSTRRRVGLLHTLKSANTPPHRILCPFFFVQFRMCSRRPHSELPEHHHGSDIEPGIRISAGGRPHPRGKWQVGICFCVCICRFCCLRFTSPHVRFSKATAPLRYYRPCTQKSLLLVLEVLPAAVCAFLCLFAHQAWSHAKADRPFVQQQQLAGPC